MNGTRWFLGLLVLAAVGCEGDKERLNRVGKTLARKARQTSDDAGLPRVKLEKPPQTNESRRSE